MNKRERKSWLETPSDPDRNDAKRAFLALGIALAVMLPLMYFKFSFTVTNTIGLIVLIVAVVFLPKN